MKKTRTIGWVGWLIALFLMVAPSMVYADWEDVLLRFQPYVTVEEEFNSNIDLTPNRIKKNDYITTLSPGLRFSTLPRSATTGEFQKMPAAEDRFGIDLDVNTGFVFYAKNHENNYISLSGALNAWYAFTPNLWFRVRDYLIRSDEIREADFSATALPGQNLVSRTNRREPYYRNVVEPSLEYRFGREDVIALNYRNNIYRIKSEISEDSMENHIHPRLTYWFDIRNGVSFEYGLMLGDFQRSPDLVGHMGMGRYTYRFNPRTSIFAEYTQLWRNFSSPSTDYVVYRPSAGVEHSFSPTLSTRVQLGYYAANPETGSTVDGPFFDVLLTQRAQRTTYTLSLLGGYTEDFFTSENQGFTQYYRVLGRITHQLLQKMTVGVFGSYEWAKNPGTIIEDRKPKDQIWAAGGDASYQILRWLAVSLEGSHRENRSNIESRDYSEYRGIFRITAAY